MALRQDALDRAVLGAIADVLHSDILIQAVEKALTKLGSVQSHYLLTGERLILPVRRPNPNGLEAWQEGIRAGWEGLVAKDPESPYVGGRTLKCLKVKQPQ